MLVTNNDNRVFARMDVESDVRFKINGNNELRQGELTNLSAQGLAFETDQDLAQDTELFLEVNSGGGVVPPLMANAKVLRCAKSAVGKFQIACAMKISA